jgi:uncharacterized membrane protein YGL010W
MASLQEQLNAYAAYHRDPRNKATHFVGVPLVTFALFLFLSWFRFAAAPDVPLLSGAALFYFSVFLYYLSLDRVIALLQVPVTLGLLYLADWVARWPSFSESLMVFLATFVGGWIIQLVGHAFEGKRPALADNILQIFNAPLFLTAEVLFLLGIRTEIPDAFKPSQALPLPEPVVQGSEGKLQDMRV